jgi:putative ABC transport system permease protein
MGAFVWGHVGLVLIGGLICGGLLGFGIAHMLVKLLTHVFDPPPQGEIIPWSYLLVVGALTTAAIAIAARLAIRSGQRGVLETIRRL